MYCSPIGNVVMWDSHWDLVVSFSSPSLPEWALDLDTWENTGEAEEEELLKRSTDSDNNPIYARVLDSPNLEEVGK